MLIKPYDKSTPIDPTDILPVLEAMDRGTPAIEVESPPGAGKTFLAAFCMAHGIDRLQSMIYVAPSYEQCAVMCATMQRIFPGMKRRPIVFGSKSARPRQAMRFMGLGVRYVTEYADLAKAIRERHPVVTVLRKLATTKMRHVEGEAERAVRWMIIDEAWQVTDADFALIAPLAEGFVMVGDRGQIPPIVRSNIARWRNDPTGPHRPAPETLAARPHLADAVMKRPMTMSRRLPHRSAEIVQRIFYPNLPFGGARDPRRLTAPANMPEHRSAARAMTKACGNEPPGYVPVRVVGRERSNATDVAALDAMASIAVGLIEHPPLIDGKAGDGRVAESDIVLLVSRNQERRYLGTLLREAYPDITVSTANKFQGSEKAISIALHPLAGRTQVSEFDSDSGRLCVMLSRHTHACFVVHRAGIGPMLDRNVPNAPRALGSIVDWPHAGWRANREFAAWMEESGAGVDFDAADGRLDAPAGKAQEELLA